MNQNPVSSNVVQNDLEVDQLKKRITRLEAAILTVTMSDRFHGYPTGREWTKIVEMLKSNLEAAE